MIGVLVHDPAAPRVLGLSPAMRAALALQAAGATRVVVLGDGASDFARAASRDDRVRVPIEPALEAGPWPGEDGPDGAPAVLLVAQGVVADASSLRALAGATPGVRVCDAQGTWLAAHACSADDARALLAADDTAPSGGAWTDRSARGVLVRARDALGARVASRALLDSLRKPQDGWVSRALNRHLSLAATRWLVWTPVRPNALSLAILAVGLYGAWLAARGTPAALAWGGVLFQAQSVLDGCDGELSRLTFRGSRAGEWLDTIGDDLTNYGYFAGAALGLHAMGVWGSAPLYVGGLGVAVGVVASAIEYRYLIRIGSGDLLKYPLGFGNDPEPAEAATQGVLARVLGAIRPAFKRDFFVLLTMLAAIAGPYPMFAMLALFTAGACATLGAVVASEVRRGGRAP